VNIVMWSCNRFKPLAGACSLWAGVGERCSGSTKIRKPSERLERMVVVGSNRISPCLSLWAWWFFSCLLLVSDSPSFFGLVLVLNFGAILNRISFAVWAHLWGSLQPILRSFWHAAQGQSFRG